MRRTSMILKAVALVLAVVVVGVLARDFEGLRASEPCENGGPGGSGWECVELQHVWEGQCAGVDCYTAMEMCCLDPFPPDPPSDD